MHSPTGARQVLAVSGSVDGLGCWNPFRALPLQRQVSDSISRSGCGRFLTRLLRPQGPPGQTAALVGAGWSFWSAEVAMRPAADRFEYGFIRFVKRSSTIETEGGGPGMTCPLQGWCENL